MEHSNPRHLSQVLSQAAEVAEIPILPEQAELLARYISELKRWNQSINLTAIENDEEIVVKHIIDSLAATKWLDIPLMASVLDIGAGAGFPGMPIKLVRPDLIMDLLEPNEKKAAFLRYMIGMLKLRDANVISAKIEDCLERLPRAGTYHYIVVRAFKVDSCGEVIAKLVRPAGSLVLYRAAKVEVDFKLNRLALVREVEYELPSGFGHRVLSVFSPSSR
ncbi:MAG: 16S rRNA (guanine(527)-N(7))-methyltransferase RsmG [Nitrospiraceae bacterium]|nr:16S rRNA (guanine(527)-N(7))-methyltransferase RsmG [Nitrospiraceae bacterium]